MRIAADHSVVHPASRPRPLPVARWAALLAAALFVACMPSAEQKPSIPPAALVTLIEQGNAPPVLDVRTGLEYEQGHVPGARHIPHDQLASRLDELGPPGKIVVYCESGGRAARAEQLLREHGFDPVHLDGDMSAWRRGGFPTETP